MFPILQLGPLALQVPGLALLLGLWLALWLSEREAQRLAATGATVGDLRLARVTPEAVYNLAFVALVTGVVGARLVYAARYLTAYRDDPLALISPNPAALAVPEGVTLAVLAAIGYGARRGLPLRPVLDALAPALAALAVALAAAHGASGDAFGAPARLPWSIFLWDEYRHPSQIYELLAAAGVLVAWWAARRRGIQPYGQGVNFLLVVALLAVSRVFLEAFRGDSQLLGSLRLAQVAGLAVLACTMVLAPRWWRLET